MSVQPTEEEGIERMAKTMREKMGGGKRSVQRYRVGQGQPSPSGNMVEFKDYEADLAAEREAREKAEKDRDKFRQWVHDCQSGMYINCVYCGHRYGPDDEVPATMADVLKEHIEQCPDHPMSALKKEHGQLLAMTRRLDEHPEGYDGPCECKLCASYGG